MKISNIQFSNIRAFKHLELNIENGRNFLVTGNNGNGKTTFLRALSLAFCDEMGAAGLLSELPGQFITYGENEASISIVLDNEAGEKLKIQTQIFDRFGTEQVRKRYSSWENGQWQETSEEELSALDEIPHTNLFTVAYGTCLRILGKERYNHYYSADAMYSLFKIDTLLQEQELTIRRLLDQGEKSSKKDHYKIVEQNIMNMIGHMLNEYDNNIVLEGNGIYFARDKEHPSELTTKGDGVRAVVTLVLDLMSWWFLHLLDQEEINDENFHDTSQVSGVVMIDEVALYLHPSWQRKIIGNFIKVFPNVQFVFTTHAPLCVSGATDFEEEIQFVRFSKVDKVSLAEEFFLPKGYSTDEILTSMAFGLSSSMSPETEQKLARLSDNLVGKVDSMSIKEIGEVTNDIKQVSKSLENTIWHDLVQQRLSSNISNFAQEPPELGSPSDVRKLLKELESNDEENEEDPEEPGGLIA